MPFLLKALAVLVGSLFLAIGINFFLVPFRVLEGGEIGIGLIINYLWGIKPGLTVIICSIPIYILAWFRYRSYFYNSLHGMLVSSFFIDIFGSLQDSFHSYVPLNPFLSCILGGLFSGLGVSIMYRYKTTIGGTDLLAQFFSEILCINVGILILLTDMIVICIGGYLFSLDTFVFSMVSVMVEGFTTTICTGVRPFPK